MILRCARGQVLLRYFDIAEVRVVFTVRDSDGDQVERDRDARHGDQGHMLPGISPGLAW